MTYRINKKRTNLKSTTKVYNLFATINGKPIRKQITTFPSLISKIHNKWKRDVETNSCDPYPTVEKAYNEYLDIRSKDNEFYKIKHYLPQILYFKNKKLNDLKNKDFQELIIKYDFKNPNTHNRRLSVWRAFVNWCDVQGYGITTKVLYKLHKPVHEKKPVLLGNNQINTMISRCNLPHQKTFLFLALYTGMRSGEIFKLKWEDVELENSVILISGYNIKNKKLRVIPIIPKLKKHLSNLERECEYVISYLNRGIKSFTYSWRAIGKDICRIHDLRHHFATALISSGIPIRIVQFILGHRSISMTEHYSAIGKDHIQEIAVQINNGLCNINATGFLENQTTLKNTGKTGKKNLQ